MVSAIAIFSLIIIQVAHAYFSGFQPRHLEKVTCSILLSKYVVGMLVKKNIKSILACLKEELPRKYLKLKYSHEYQLGENPFCFKSR